MSDGDHRSRISRQGESRTDAGPEYRRLGDYAAYIGTTDQSDMVIASQGHKLSKKEALAYLKQNNQKSSLHSKQETTNQRKQTINWRNIK